MLCRIVVDRQVTGFGVAHQLDPVASQVADGFAQCILRRHLWLGFLQPCLQLRQHRQAVLLSAFVAMFIGVHGGQSLRCVFVVEGDDVQLAGVWILMFAHHGFVGAAIG